MRFFRFILYLACCTFLLACILLQARIPLVEYGLPLLLPEEIFSDTSLELEVLDPGRIRLAGFKTSIRSARGIFALEAETIDIAFTTAMLRQGVVNKLVANTLWLTLPPASPDDRTSSPGQAPTIPQLDNFIRQLHALVIPVRYVEIERLFLRNGPKPISPNDPLTITFTSSKGKAIQFDTLFPVAQSGFFKLAGEREEDGSLKAEITAEDQSGPHSLVRASLAGTELRAECNLDFEQAAALLPDLALPLQSGAVRWNVRLELSKGFPFEAEIKANDLARNTISASKATLALSGQISDLGSIHLSPSSRLEISGLRVNNTGIGRLALDLAGSFRFDQGNFEAALSSSTPLTVEAFESSPVGFDTLNLEHPVVVRKDESEVSIHLPEHSQFNVDSLRLSPISLDKLTLSPVSGQPLVLRLVNGLELTGPVWQITPSAVAHPAVSVETTPVTFYTDEVYFRQGPFIKLRAETSQLTVENNATRLPLSGISGTLTLTPHSLQGRFSAGPQYVEGLLEATLAHNSSTGAGSLILETGKAIRFSDNKNSSLLWQGLQPPLTLHSGELFLKGECSWVPGKPLGAAASMAVRDGSGSLLMYSFSGLNSVARLQLLPDIRTVQPADITLDRIETPVPLTNITARPALAPSMTGSKPLLSIDQLQADLLEGQLSSDQLILDLNHPEYAVTLQAREISLPAVVQLLKIKGLGVSGKVSARIPLRIDSAGIRVDHGEILGTGDGGSIRYTPPGQALDQTGLPAYAIKALEEFNYTQLQAPLTYDSDGTLKISLHLKGRSPRLDPDQPIHLNINTQQNLLSLLQSLQYSKTMMKQIDKRLQK